MTVFASLLTVSCYLSGYPQFQLVVAEFQVALWKILLWFIFYEFRGQKGGKKRWFELFQFFVNQHQPQTQTVMRAVIVKSAVWLCSKEQQDTVICWSSFVHFVHLWLKQRMKAYFSASSPLWPQFSVVSFKDKNFKFGSKSTWRYTRILPRCFTPLCVFILYVHIFLYPEEQADFSPFPAGVTLPPLGVYHVFKIPRLCTHLIIVSS